jgi:hypothetical protein
MLPPPAPSSPKAILDGLTNLISTEILKPPLGMATAPPDEQSGTLATTLLSMLKLSTSSEYDPLPAPDARRTLPNVAVQLEVLPDSKSQARQWLGEHANMPAAQRQLPLPSQVWPEPLVPQVVPLGWLPETWHTCDPVLQE